MTPDTIQIICLANSRKHGGRCVAGIRTDGGGWIRPVADFGDGSLFYYHYKLPDKSEPLVLDVVSFHVDHPQPGPHHPEDWVLRNLPWELNERPASARWLDMLHSQLCGGPEIFGNTLDRIPSAQVRATPLKSSLALVEPQRLSWRIGLSSKGKRQCRAVFTLAGAATPWASPIRYGRLAWRISPLAITLANRPASSPPIACGSPSASPSCSTTPTTNSRPA